MATSKLGSWLIQLSFRVVARIALISTLGCMRWSGAPVNAAMTLPATLRLHLHDGSTVVVQKAVVSTDSIVGVPWGSAPAGSRIAVARAQVERVDIGTTDDEKTTWLLLGLLVAVPIGALVWGVRHSYDT